MEDYFAQYLFVKNYFAVISSLALAPFSASSKHHFFTYLKFASLFFWTTADESFYARQYRHHLLKLFRFFHQIHKFHRLIMS